MPSSIPASATRRRLARVAATPAVAGGAVLVAGFLLLGLLAPWVLWRDPLEQDLAAFLEPPASGRWFGTDELGRDLAARVVAAARADLLLVGLGIGFAVVLALPL